MMQEIERSMIILFVWGLLEFWLKVNAVFEKADRENDKTVYVNSAT